MHHRHATPAGFPENAARVDAIEKRFEKDGIFARGVRLKGNAPDDKWLKLVHTDAYLKRLRAACATGDAFIDSRDVPICKDSELAARTAVADVLGAVDAVMAGRVKNAFCAIRPPGHHASANRAMGFCIYNNVAIAAKYIQTKYHLARVLIVDFDVHHGNGTQATFDADPTVFYFSVHQSPFYPRTGGADETGVGAAKGTKINVPLAAGSGDAQALAAFKNRLVPAARKFKPDFILISAGFDAHKNDPIGGLAYTPAGYAALTRIVKKIAFEECHGRLVSLLEGGYNPDALAESAEAHVRTLMENDEP
ncbi:histone deacetylase [bacterium]|nr:histone deacetylase [bacterium]